jgi:lysophospholipase L1-like esterase
MNDVVLLLSMLLLLPTGDDQVTDNTRSDLGKIRQGRVLFGHQSVGANVLQGVKEVAETLGHKAPRIVPMQDQTLNAAPFLAEISIGTNGNPGSKCAEFLRHVSAFPAEQLDVALMKFCYVDFTPQTDVNQIFQLYQRTVDSLRAAFPHLVIVHCTAPLTARTPWWKRFATWVLGREDLSDGGNIKRNEYNERLRQQFNSEPIFDIAACEATLAGGTRSSFTANGKVIYTLANQYTSDGGHLNQLGRKVAAEESVKVVANALELKRQSAMDNQ